MKIYVIVRRDYEYDDEYYYRPESDGEVTIAAFKSRARAAIELDKLNEREREEWGDVRETCSGEIVQTTHIIRALEVNEDEVEGA